VNLARIVQKGGLLVFFPSYDALSSAVDYWKTPVSATKSHIRQS
jgi:Rad3-related DNA helicase